MTDDTSAAPLSADEVLGLLGLEPHPEGGAFRETFRDPATCDGRSVGTAIYFMLRRGERSAWHRVDAGEIWHWYAGAPLTLDIAPDGDTAPDTVLMGNDLAAGERPQAIVPAGAWQSAATTGDWTLVGCTVSPGFEFEGFELARAGWRPGEGR